MLVIRPSLKPSELEVNNSVQAGLNTAGIAVKTLAF